MSRNYSSIVEPKTLTADVLLAATQITLNNVTGLPSEPYVLVLNPDTASEEVILVDADQSGVTSPTLKVTRAIETGATAKTHTNGDTVKHMIVGSDLQLVHDHIDLTAAHGATGAVVGTTNTQTLTNKTLTLPKVNENVTVTATATELNILDGATLSTAELNYVDGVTSAIQTQLDTIVNTTIPASTPVGTIVMYGGTTAPAGWLLCNGQSTAGYDTLAALVGANVPDLMGRAPIGYGTSADAGITARGTIGAKTGTEEVTLTEAQMPSHTHTYQFGRDGSLGTSNTYITQVSPTLVTVGASSGAGSGAAHPNMQPSTVVNFIIKH